MASLPAGSGTGGSFSPRLPAEELLRELLALDNASFLYTAGTKCQALYALPVSAKIALLGVLNRRSVTSSGEPAGVFATGDLLVIVDVFLHTKGRDLTVLKLGLEACLGTPGFIHHDLLNLFSAVLRAHGAAKGEALLKHFREEGERALQEWHQERLEAFNSKKKEKNEGGKEDEMPSSSALQPWWPIKLYSDFDDTMMPKLLDHSYPSGPYPGVAAFVFALQGLDPSCTAPLASAVGVGTAAAAGAAAATTTGQGGQKSQPEPSPGSSVSAGGSRSASDVDADELPALRKPKSLQKELTVSQTKVRRRKRDAVRSWIKSWVPSFGGGGGGNNNNTSSAAPKAGPTAAESVSAAVVAVGVKEEEESSSSNAAEEFKDAKEAPEEEHDTPIAVAIKAATAEIAAKQKEKKEKAKRPESSDEDIDVAGFSSADEGPNEKKGAGGADDDSDDDEEGGSVSAAAEMDAELAFLSTSVKASCSASCPSSSSSSSAAPPFSAGVGPLTASSSPSNPPQAFVTPIGIPHGDGKDHSLASPILSSSSSQFAASAGPPSPLRKSSLLMMTPSGLDSDFAAAEPGKTPTKQEQDKEKDKEDDHGNFFSPAPEAPALETADGKKHNAATSGPSDPSSFLTFECPTVGHRGISGITYLSARPPLLKGKTLKLVTELLGPDHLPQAILCGSLMNLATHAGMASKKIANYRLHRRLFPEFRVVWLGDSGQGDIQAGLEMLALHQEDEKDAANSLHKQVSEKKEGATEDKLPVGGAAAIPEAPTSAVLAAASSPSSSWYPPPKPLVLIHDICNAEQRGLNADASKRSEFLAKGIHLFDSYIDAARIAFEHGLVALPSFTAVIDSVTAELPEITFGTVAQRDGRLADYHKAMRAAREAMDRFHHGSALATTTITTSSPQQAQQQQQEQQLTQPEEGERQPEETEVETMTATAI